MSLFGGAKPQSQQQTVYNAIQLQTSTFGKVLPIIYGTTRVAANLIWYGDFTAAAVQSSGGGGKGIGGAGGKGGGSTTYRYSAAVAMALGEGPIAGIGNVFVSKTVTTLSAINLSLFPGSYPQAAWTYLELSHQAIPEIHVVPSSAPYTVTVTYTQPFIGDYGVVDAAGTVFSLVATPSAANQYAVNAATGTYTFYSANAGDQVTISYTAGNQVPPDQSLAYTGIAYLAGYYQLGSNAELPNHNFEVQGILSASVPGQVDADPSQVVADFLTNPHYGAGFPAARIGDLSTYQAYCLATGLLISPAYTQQDQAGNVLNEIATATNSAFVWSSGKLTLVPYGDQAATGNGRTYTPPAAPLYDLTDDDFLPNTNGTGSGSSYNQDPVSLVRRRPSDQINDVKLEFLNRANQYNAEVVEAKDEAMITLYGLRAASSSQAHLFCSAAAARQSAQLQLQRQAIRNIYSFTLDQRYILLDPMDIVTVTDAALGLSKQWVRIQEITEDEEGNLAVTAEEYLAGTGSAALYSFNTSYSYAADYNTAPPLPNAPLIFDAPVALSGGGLAAWLVASGPAGWGGADVWISSDNATYKLAGRIQGPARQGVLTAALPVGADPDTGDTLMVDLSQSGGQLLSGSQQDADLLHTLCIVDNELLAYATATLTGAGRYSLSYLRRGAYGSAIAAHAAGAPFARLDQGAGFLALPYTAAQIGATIYVKLTSFNLWGGGEQELAEVEPYTYVIQGPPPPPSITSFSAQQQNNVVAFKWTPVADGALIGYDIRYGPLGSTAWTQLIPLTESALGTEMTNAEVPPGSWLFAICAKDVAGQYSPLMATASLTVVNGNNIVDLSSEAPLWPGALAGFVRHYTGVLAPDSSVLAGSDTAQNVFDLYVWKPVVQATYTAAGFTLPQNAPALVYATITASLGPGAAGRANPLLNIRYSTSGGASPAMWNASPATAAMWNASPAVTLMWAGPGPWTSWTKGIVVTGFVQHQLVVNTADGLAVIQGFSPEVDQPSLIDKGSATVAAGGTVIPFNQQYLIPPHLVTSLPGGVAGTASASNVTSTGFTGQVFNAAGTDVGGTLSYVAST